MFSPRREVTTFMTKSGKKATIRYFSLEDAPAALSFINTVSRENTYIRFAGEQQTLEEEKKYLQSEVEKSQAGDAVKLFCFVGRELAGVCDVHRDTSLLSRRLHVGIFGLVIAKPFRGDGIGFALAQTTIQEAKEEIEGLRLVKLDCFAINTPALSLYAKLGFVEVGRIPDMLFYKGEYVDEVEMVLRTV